MKGAGELSVAETYADVTGRECDGTLQRERFYVKQGGTAGIRLSLREDERFFVT